MTPENQPGDAPPKRRVNPNSLKNLVPSADRGNGGGARKNAGRPKGALGKLTKENVARAKAGGIMPLDLLLQEMRYFDRQLARERARGKRRDRKREFELSGAAQDAATRAAPFLHPKIASIEHSGNVQLTHEQALDQLDDEEDEGK